MRTIEDWERAVAAVGMPPLHSRRITNEDFHPSLVSGELGPLRLAKLVTPPGDCYRDTRLVRANHRGLCQIEVILEGWALAEQGGRQAEVGLNDLVVIDPAQPVRFSSSATTSVTILVQGSLLGIGADDLSQLSAVRIPGDRGPGALVSSLARGLTRSLGGIQGEEAITSGNAVVDLIAVALRAQLGGRHPATDRALRARVLSFIEAWLPDPELSPAAVAAAHHISVRRLHQLFETESLTVAALIRWRRLERCRRDLADPAFRELTVAAIGARWGFSDPSHFSRLFKAAYGYTAAEHRKLH
ncbi:helix-turn-helix domain-containing protein [Streptomyces sp. NPDC002018]|uniref:helix-turn-helix domain-containing protein n=1 Tax=Streptomyces sp. NPDC002018 TaxID=3364629 RepID=UPI0036852A34